MNAARLIGPAIGGLLIGIVGVTGCFFLNGLSFLAVIFGLWLIHEPAHVERRLGSIAQVRRDLREGIRYVRASTPTLGVILLAGAIGIFGANFNVVVPILARNVLNVGPTGMGWLMAAMGVGSLVGSLGLAYLGTRPRPAAPESHQSRSA